MKRDAALRHLAPLDAPTKGVAVQDALVAMIEAAGLGIGDRLPPEVALATALGVGRSTIREAMNRWEGLGIIRRRRGDGTYLTARVQSSQGPLPTMIRLEGEALLRLLEVRRVLETGTVRRAAQHATPEQRRGIATLCDALLAVVSAGLPYREADWAFHGAISDATGNPMFGQLLVHLDHAFERSEDAPFNRNAFGLRSFPIHRDLSDAILRGDADGAAAAINAIIDSVAAEIRQIIDAGPTAPGIGITAPVRP
jgi:GntR family transcriptional regulator, transcriptional repressor for pyruvate dehydrogenase complex